MAYEINRKSRRAIIRNKQPHIAQREKTKKERKKERKRHFQDRGFVRHEIQFDKSRRRELTNSRGICGEYAVDPGCEITKVQQAKRLGVCRLSRCCQGGGRKRA